MFLLPFTVVYGQSEAAGISPTVPESLLRDLGLPAEVFSTTSPLRRVLIGLPDMQGSVLSGLPQVSRRDRLRQEQLAKMAELRRQRDGEPISVVIPGRTQTEEKTISPREEAINTLRAKGYPFNATAFVNAARADEAEIVLLFLTAGMPPDSTNAFGQSALQAAASSNAVVTAELLIAADADVNYVRGERDPALIEAVKRSYQSMAERLIDAGALIDQLGRDQRTALQHAVQERNLVIAKQLIDAGAFTDHSDRYGITPLMMAVQLNDLSMATLLLKAEATVDLADFGTTTPLALAVSKGLREMTQLLVEAGANPQQRTVSGGSLLALALDNGHLDVANLLLAYGVRE